MEAMTIHNCLCPGSPTISVASKKDNTLFLFFLFFSRRSVFCWNLTLRLARSKARVVRSGKYKSSSARTHEGKNKCNARPETDRKLYRARPIPNQSSAKRASAMSTNKYICSQQYSRTTCALRIAGRDSVARAAAATPTTRGARANENQSRRQRDARSRHPTNAFGRNMIGEYRRDPRGEGARRHDNATSDRRHDYCAQVSLGPRETLPPTARSLGFVNAPTRLSRAFAEQRKPFITSARRR